MRVFITNYRVQQLPLKQGTYPALDKTIRITRSSSQATRLNDYADASLLTADTLDADANQLFFIAQEALDTASETNLAAATFYSSGYYSSLKSVFR